MKLHKLHRSIVWPFMIVVGVFSLCLTGCKEDIDESNLYTFTGETIEDYLTNRDDQFSSFNYILKRIGYDKILSAYGTYTCFAPNNQAVESYIDSLYDDTTNKDLPHNGMTQRGLDGLTDSLCNDIAKYHLHSNEALTTIDMGGGSGSISTMLRVPISSDGSGQSSMTKKLLITNTN